jgi:hypothetical protein
LFVNVLVLINAEFWLKIPPPSCAEFPENVLVETVKLPLLSIAPPDVPLVAGDEFPVKVLAVTESLPWLKIPPPPWTPLLARPLLTVNELSVKVPLEATSSKRKAGVPAAVERAMVAPLPVMVTLPVMTGRPVPPSVALFAVVRV